MILSLVAFLSLCAPVLHTRADTWQPKARLPTAFVADQSVDALGTHTNSLESLAPVEQPVIPDTNDAKWPTFSSHRCVGVPLYNLTCHFTDLVYDSVLKTYIYYAAPEADTCAPPHPIYCCGGDFNRVYISVAVFAEISLMSPRKIFIFIIKKYIYRIKVSKK